VGVSATVEADFLVETVQGEDIALLCSDGLYNYLDEGVSYDALRQCMKSGSAQPLVELSNAHGGADNITAVLISGESFAPVAKS
jgi:protein phosphatase